MTTNTDSTQLILRIDWSDLDLFGHVNNVAFYRYMQAARVQFWQQIGLYEKYESEGIAPLLVSATIDFKKPLHFPGKAIIDHRPVFVRNTSFGLEYSIMDEEGITAAKGHDAMVLYDFRNACKLEFPAALRKSIKRFMNR